MSDFELAYPAVLALLPVVWAVALGARGPLRRRRSDLPSARVALARDVLRKHLLLRGLIALPPLLRLLALTAIVVALARPRSTDSTVVSGEGIDVLFALDMSGSMNAVDLTDDAIVKHQERGEEPPNRFETARVLLSRFVEARREDRIGLVIFGKEAYLKFPPTLDYDRIVEDMKTLVLDDGRRGRADRCSNACTIDGGGTAIGDALARGYRRLRRSDAKSRVIVLITDGKNEGGRIDPDTMADELARLPEGERIQVYTILVGDPALTRLPVVDPFTGSFARARDGSLVYRRPGRSFPTDPDLLRRVAERTGGVFWETPDQESFRQAFSDLERTLFQKELTIRHRELFMTPVLVALGLLLLEGLLAALVLRRVP